MKIKRTIERFLIPHYDELTLYTMSVTLVLLIATGIISKLPTSDLSFSPLEYEPSALILAFLLFLGLCLSIYHAFSKRTKALLEKKIMLFYAVVINGFSGIWAGYVAMEDTAGLVLIFPVLNIISGFFLFSLLRVGRIDEGNVSDENVTMKQVFTGTVIVAILYTLCHLVFETSWAITLSICVAYSTNLSPRMDGLRMRVRNIIHQV